MGWNPSPSAVNGKELSFRFFFFNMTLASNVATSQTTHSQKVKIKTSEASRYKKANTDHEAQLTAGILNIKSGILNA